MNYWLAATFICGAGVFAACSKGDENFEKWRAAHPQELPKMPDLELEK